MSINSYKYIFNVSKCVKYIQSVFAFISLFLLSAVIKAQTVDLGGISLDRLAEEASKPEDEWTLKILKAFLGEKFVNNPFSTVGPPETVAGAVIFCINAAIFVVSVGLVGYIVVSIIVKNATTGESVLSSTDNVIMPARMTAGIFGMLPVFGGFSLAQAIFLSVATLGIGLGNVAKNEVVTWTSQMQSMTPNIESLQGANGNIAGEIRNVSENLFFSYLCAEVVNDKVDYLRSIDINAEKIRVYEETHTGARLQVFGECGMLKFQRRRGTEYREGDERFSFRIKSVNYDAINVAAYYAATTQFDNLNTKTKNLAQGIIRAAKQQSPDGQLYSDYLIGMAEPVKNALDLISDEAHKALTRDIYSSSRGEFNALTPEIEAEMRSRGWSSLGAYYQTFAEVGAAVADAQQAWSFEWHPGPSLLRVREELKKVADPSLNMYIPGGKALQNGPGDPHQILFTFFRDWQLRNPVQADASDLLCNEKAGKSATGDCSVGQSIVMWMLDAANAGSGGGEMINPIYTSKQLGDFLMTFGSSILAAGPVTCSVFSYHRHLGNGMG